MAILPPGAYPGALLGAHESRQLVCQSPRDFRSPPPGAPGQQAPEVVGDRWLGAGEHLDLVQYLPHEGYVKLICAA